MKGDSIKTTISARAPVATEVNKIDGYKDGYTPLQIKHAYGMDKIDSTGHGQRIAIIVAFGSATIEKDLNIFNKQFNLETANLNIVFPQGRVYGTKKYWALETSLNVEWVHALAPKASILLVVAKSSSYEDLLGAIDYANNNNVQVISMSWGCNEFKEQTAYDSYFEHRNVVYIASSGDGGPGVSWPAVSPNVLAVGGTNLHLDSNGNLLSEETAWTGSGGGISEYEFEPAYQINHKIISNNHRAVPDISFNAGHLGDVATYCSIENTGWFVDGGTSLGSPALAAFIALVNQKRTTPLEKIHEKLYDFIDEEEYNINFRDIVNGDNRAKKGYDYVTGLGSPVMNNLFLELLSK